MSFDMLVHHLRGAINEIDYIKEKDEWWCDIKSTQRDEILESIKKLLEISGLNLNNLKESILSDINSESESESD